MKYKNYGKFRCSNISLSDILKKHLLTDLSKEEIIYKVNKTTHIPIDTIESTLDKIINNK